MWLSWLSKWSLNRLPLRPLTTSPAPDDNLEGTEAKVGCGGWCLSGNCVAMATKREPVCYMIFFFTEAVSGNIKQENGVYFSIVMVQ